MDRLFKRSDSAKYFYLNKMWDFVTDPEKKGESERYYETFPKNSRKMAVPSCWNTEIGLFRYTGTAWYRTFFYSESENIYLKFEGVQNECDVYLDGKKIGSHYGGFLEFGFEVNSLKKGEHELVLRVNNETNDVNTYPLTVVDWFNYGGISRPVEVIELSDVWLSSIRVNYTLENDYKDALLWAEIKIKTYKPVTDELRLFLDGKTVYKKSLTVDGEAVIATDKIIISDVRLWDIYKPELYMVKAEFSGSDLYERIGFREIKTEHKDILLNGRKIRLLGINRHEEHPDWGFSMPFKLIKRDIDIIKSMNCNAIRSSHYPNSAKTADYLDEVGMLFWSELPLWGRPEAAMTDPLAVSRVLEMEKEMINAGINHPSIIIWSMHNECATDTKGGYELTKKMTELARRMDDSRIITYVSNRSGDARPDICYSLADMICMNAYISWYNDVKREDWKEFLKRQKKMIKACDALDKPYVMTEFGAGAIAGFNSFEAQRWSEDYQVESLKFSLEQLLSQRSVTGVYIWQYCDIRTSAFYELSRPRSFNNKGILDEYRRPKRAYYTVRDIYGKHSGKKAENYKIKLFGY